MNIVDYDGFNIFIYCRELYYESVCANRFYNNDFRWKIGTYWYEKINNMINEIIYDCQSTDGKDRLFGIEVDIDYKNPMNIDLRCKYEKDGM